MAFKKIVISITTLSLCGVANSAIIANNINKSIANEQLTTFDLSFNLGKHLSYLSNDKIIEYKFSLNLGQTIEQLRANNESINMWNVMSIQKDKFQFANVRGFYNKLVELFDPISQQWINTSNIDFESFSNTDTKDCGIDPSIGITTPYECHSWLDGLNPTIHTNNVFWFNVFD